MSSSRPLARIIPTELLAKIFMLSLPTQGEAAAVGRMSLDESPWVLARVCATWRAISLDMPCLWTSLVIAIPSAPTLSPTFSPNLSRCFPLALVREYLARSRNRPLSIVFTSLERAPARTTRSLFRLITSVSERWEALELDARAPLPVQRLCGKLPLLRRLYLCGGRQTPLPWRQREDGLSQGITGVIPWQQLTEYKTVYFDGLSIERMHAAKELVECQCVVRWRPDLVVTRFEYLRKLSLTVYPDLAFTNESRDCLDSLVLPALEDFYIEDFTPNFSSLLVSLLARSGCSLKKLWVKSSFNVALTADAFEAIAERNPHLEELGLISITLPSGPIVLANSWDCIMSKLVITPGLHPLLPELCSLHIVANDIYFHLLVDMLESRRRHGLKLMTVSVPVPYDRALKRRLDALQAGGLDIQAMRKIQNSTKEQLTYL